MKMLRQGGMFCKCTTITWLVEKGVKTFSDMKVMACCPDNVMVKGEPG